MTTKRQTFTAQTKKAVLLDLHNQPVLCSVPGCTCKAVDIHHQQYVSEGGTNDVSNLKALCKKHHIELHSANGDFRVWGQKGGKATAKTGAWRKNLKQFRTSEANAS